MNNQALEAAARALCPYMDGHFAKEGFKCDCEIKVDTPYGGGTRGCFAVAEEAAQLAVTAYLEAQPSDYAELVSWGRNVTLVGEVANMAMARKTADAIEALVAEGVGRRNSTFAYLVGK